MSIKNELQEEEGKIQTITGLLSLCAIATTASEYFVKSEAKCIEVRLSHNSVDIRACIYFSFFFSIYFFDGSSRFTQPGKSISIGRPIKYLCRSRYAY